MAHQRTCPHCGHERSCKGRHHIVFRTPFGKLRLESPRLYHCQCESDGRTSFSPLAETAKRSNGWWRNSKPVDCGGVNFVRSIIWRSVHCSVGSEGAGWKSRDKAKVSDWWRSRWLGPSATAADRKPALWKWCWPKVVELKSGEILMLRL